MIFDYRNYKVNVPVGEKGDWKVERFMVSEEESKAYALSVAFTPGAGGRTVPPGEYTRLVRKGIFIGTVVMSDTPAEIRDLSFFIEEAKGKVLINGLGLGVVLGAVLRKPEVTEVIVVEKSQDVVDLVGGYYKKGVGGEKLQIIVADALVWRPEKGERFDIVWHDIWDDICLDNLEEMKVLHRAYGRRCDKQYSWQRDWLLYYKRRNGN